MRDNMTADVSKQLDDWYASASVGREEAAGVKSQAQFGCTPTLGRKPHDQNVQPVASYGNSKAK